jgi:branched-chain amino acid transport system permease protein
MAFAFLALPFLVNDYWVNSLIVPVLIYSIAALGLNILTGYCGQLSLGTGGFMAVGAYASFKLMTSFPELNIIIVILLSGVVTAGVGVLFGLPSLRIKGFYLAVATLAAQFFLVWLFTRTPWFFNNSPTGMIQTPTRAVFGIPITGASTSAVTMYIVCLSFLVVLAWLARNLTRGRIGRMWKAVRDMDIAAELIGISLMRAKLLAFAISSFYIGISGALLFAVYLGAIEASEAFRYRQVIPGPVHDNHRRTWFDLWGLCGRAVPDCGACIAQAPAGQYTGLVNRPGGAPRGDDHRRTDYRNLDP